MRNAVDPVMPKYNPRSRSTSQTCRQHQHPYPEKNREVGEARDKRNMYFMRTAVQNGLRKSYKKLGAPMWAQRPNEPPQYFDPAQEHLNGWYLYPSKAGPLRHGDGPLKIMPYMEGDIKVWPIEFFISNRHALAYDSGEQKHFNNHAMKFLRDQLERTAGVPDSDNGFATFGLDLTFAQLDICDISLPQIIHGGQELKTPMSWSFEYSGTPVRWSWQRMLASFTDADLQKLASNGGGIVGCKLMQRCGSYDHKRSDVRNHEGRPFAKHVVCPMWDFVIFSSTGDATGIRPRWDSTRFDIHAYVLRGHRIFGDDNTGKILAPPGMSAGPGTFKYVYCKQDSIDTEWRQIPAVDIIRQPSAP